MNIKIIEKHDEILDIITEPINCLVSFDWHSDYPLYNTEEIDIYYYSQQIDKVYYEQNWIAILASKGLVKEFTWIFPHDYNEESYKKFKSYKGDSVIHNMKFFKELEIDCEYITIDMDFFGSRIPVDWNPDNRNELFKNVLNSIQNKDAIIIISKSKNYVNYDVDNFLTDVDYK